MNGCGRDLKERAKNSASSLITLYPPRRETLSRDNSIKLSTALVPTPLGHPCQPVNTNGSRNIKGNVYPHQPKVPPRVTPITADTRQEGVCRRHRAVCTLARCIWVLNAPSTGRSKCSQVLGACLVCRGVDLQSLDRVANHLGSANCSG